MLCRSIVVLLAGASIPAFPAHAQTAPVSADSVAAAHAALKDVDEGLRKLAEAQAALDRVREDLRAAQASAEAVLAAQGQPAPAAPVVASPPSQTAGDHTPRSTGAAKGMTGLPVIPDAQGETLSAKAKEFGSGLAGSVANGPNGSPLKSTGAVDFQLIASSKDKVASVAFTVNLKNRYDGIHLRSDQLTATATGNLDDNGSSQVVGLGGFSSGTGIKISYVHYQTKLVLNGTAINSESVKAAEAECLRELGPSSDKCVADQYGDGGISIFVQKYDPQGVRSLINLVLPKPIWFYGLSFDGNQASYKFINRAEFATKKVDHFGFGGTLFGGIIANEGLTSVIGSFDYRRNYNEGDQINLCQPLEGTPQTQCLTGPDGAPTRETTKIAALEFRHAFKFADGVPRLAIAPKFSADFDSKAWSIEMPIYFVGDGTGKLRGGIQGLYKNTVDKNGQRAGTFSAGLFVGVPFSVFKQ